jgi:cytochrome c oxidase assembly protein subunit 15
MDDEHPRGLLRAADMLACGFGASVAMWGVGYVCRLPYVNAPGWLVLALMLLALAAAGYACGRLSARGVLGGLGAGIVSGVLNLLILGSLLGGEQSSAMLRSALWWVPASILLSGMVCAVGAAAARRQAPPGVNWLTGFARVAAVATLLLVAAGGLVTSNDAGLAVVDWPNTFGTTMFLYPLSRMVGGIYFEHSHRLLGSLVGLTVLMLALLTQSSALPRRVKLLAWAAFVLTAVQGLLGGLRVTGEFTLSTDPTVMAPSRALAVVHGVTGQVVFALVLALSVLVSTSYAASQAQPRRTASIDLALSTWLAVLLVPQVVLGALVRHLNWGLQLHITVACIVLLLALACGVRAWGMYADVPMVSRKGAALIHLAGGQFVLGLGAWIVTGLAKGAVQPPLWDVLVATAHQTVGALLFAWAVMYMLWAHRLLKQAPSAPSI